MVWNMFKVFHVATFCPTSKLLKISDKNMYMQSSLYPISSAKL